MSQLGVELSAPASTENLFQHVTAAEIRKAKDEEAPKIQVDSTFSSPSGELAAGYQNAKERECEQG